MAQYAVIKKNSLVYLVSNLTIANRGEITCKGSMHFLTFYSIIPTCSDDIHSTINKHQVYTLLSWAPDVGTERLRKAPPVLTIRSRDL